MEKLFGNIKMTWLKVIIFAVAAGAYTGAVMLIPFLKGTSFQDIGIGFEWWVVFAVIIVVNCDKCWEAMLKCFVFFLISQPVVYLVQILFGDLTFEKAWYYYHSFWLLATFFTLPGGLIAYFCKKQNLLGGIVLGLGNTIEALMAFYYINQARGNFPHHILSAAFCIASVIVMSICIQKTKKIRLLSLLIPVVLAVFVLVVAEITGLSLF